MLSSAIGDFQTYLLAGSLAFDGGATLAAGTNLTTVRNTPSPDNQVTLVLISSPSPVRRMGGIVHYNTMIQVLVRATSQALALDMARKIVTRMDNYVGTIGSTRYLWVALRSGPFALGVDENNRPRVSLTFEMKGETP